MINPREFLYINTYLEKEERGIWTRYFHKGYEVAIQRSGKYTLNFESYNKAISFAENICGKEDVELLIDETTLTIIKKNSNKTIGIKCLNKWLADELTKHLRKQWVLNRKQRKNETLKETGLKL